MESYVGLIAQAVGRGIYAIRSALTGELCGKVLWMLPSGLIVINRRTDDRITVEEMLRNHAATRGQEGG